MEANQRRRSPLPKQSGPHSSLPQNGHPRGLTPGRDPVPRQVSAPASPILEGLGSLTQVGRRQEPFEKGIVAGERRGTHRDHCGIAVPRAIGRASGRLSLTGRWREPDNRFVKTFAVALLASALLSMCGTAAAKPLTRHGLNASCRIWGNQEDTAFACDPAGGARTIRMTLGAESRTGRGRDAIDSVGSGEPLTPGETVTLDWAHPSRHAELLVHAGSPTGPRDIVFELAWRPTHVEVTANADGSVLLRTAARTAMLPPPAPLPQPVWQERSARSAALRIVKSLDRMERSPLVWRTFCAALDPDVGATLGIPAGGIQLDTSLDPVDQCLATIYININGDENTPTPISTRHRGFSVKVRGSRAVFATTLTHRYHLIDGGQRKRSVHARALLVRDAAGIWRLGTLVPLLPLELFGDTRTFTDRRLAALFARDRRFGRKQQARFVRREAALSAATVQAGTAPPCAATTVSDKPADVNWNEGLERARHQLEHLDVDLTAIGLTGPCFVLRTAGPLPDDFSVQLDQAAHVDVHHGRVIVYEHSSRSGEIDKPVGGVVASLSGNEFVLRLPAAPENVEDVMLIGAPHGVEYDDTHTLR